MGRDPVVVRHAHVDRVHAPAEEVARHSGLPGVADAELLALGREFEDLAARLNELGVSRYAQLAQLSDNEIAHLDERLGPFRGRLARDLVPEQADYLARGDAEGFEERFGKLGG